VSVVTNAGNATPHWMLNLGNTRWAVGTTVVDVLTCEKSTIGSDGSDEKLVVPTLSRLPRACFEAGKAASGSNCSD
jgi:alpha-amylase